MISRSLSKFDNSLLLMLKLKDYYLQILLFLLQQKFFHFILYFKPLQIASNPFIVDSNSTSFPGEPVNTSATKKG